LCAIRSSHARKGGISPELPEAVKGSQEDILRYVVGVVAADHAADNAMNKPPVPSHERLERGHVAAQGPLD